MDFEKAYKNLVAKVKNAHLYAQTDSTKNVLEDILPELRESEDDEEIYREIYTIIHHSYQERAELLINPNRKKELLSRWEKAKAYLEKQKEQKPAEWSEKNKTIVEGACSALEVYGHTKLASSLKSLRPSWKPSEEQMEALRYVAYEHGNSSLSPYSIANKTLASLYEQLKKL